MKLPMVFTVFLVFLAACQIKPDSPATTYASASLQNVYQHAFLIGCALNDDIIASREDSARIVTKQFNSITPENVMKAEYINPQPGIFNFAAADAFVDFGIEHQMFIVGHTLVWHNQTPAWFFHDQQGVANTAEQQIERMRQHIEAVAGRYAGRVHAWDVVNEVIDNDGSYRPTSWVNRVGDGDILVKNAFLFASRYAPDSELYYNDFNAWRPEKVAGIVRMITMLQQAGIRIDGIGMQGHWGLNYPKQEYIEAAIDAYSALGIKVMITELDIDVLPLTKEGQIIGTGMTHPQFQLEEFATFLDPYPNGLPEDIENQLSQRYADLFELFYRKRQNISRVTFWGLDDSMSWKNDYPIPNRTNYPLLYNRDLNAKPALKAIMNIPKRQPRQ